MNHDVVGDRHPTSPLSLGARNETPAFIGSGTVKDMIFDGEAGPVFTVANVLLTLHAICLRATASFSSGNLLAAEPFLNVGRHFRILIRIQFASMSRCD